MDVSGLWSFEYSISFQIMQIPATSHYFSCQKSLPLCSSRFLKKHNIFSSLRYCFHRQANKKNIFQLKKYFKTLKEMIIGTASTQLFEPFTFFQSEWDNVVEIWEFDPTSRAYSRPIPSSDIERCPLLRKLFKALFRCKTRNFWCPFFKKKVPFLANIERCPKFLEYALTRGIYL